MCTDVPGPLELDDFEPIFVELDFLSSALDFFPVLDGN